MNQYKSFTAIVLLSLSLVIHLEAQDKPEKIGGHVSPPQLIEGNPAGISEPSSKPKSRFKGMAVFSVVIGPEGHITQAKLVHSTGHGDLDQRALDTIREWKFKPALKDGKPVAVYSNVDIHFDLY